MKLKSVCALAVVSMFVGYDTVPRYAMGMAPGDSHSAIRTRNSARTEVRGSQGDLQSAIEAPRYAWSGTVGRAVYIRDITTDAAGNVYYSGEFWVTMDMDPTEGIDEHTAVGYCDIFVTKLHADGSYAWTRTMGGPDSDGATQVLVLSDGDILIVGTFFDTVDFDPTDGVDERTPIGYYNAFVTRLGSDGSGRPRGPGAAPPPSACS